MVDILSKNLSQWLYRVFFFTGPPLKKTKSKTVLEYPDWASPGPPKNVKVYELGLPLIQWFSKCQTGPPLNPVKSSLIVDLGEAQSDT